jgi:hypothetical protein
MRRTMSKSMGEIFLVSTNSNYRTRSTVNVSRACPVASRLKSRGLCSLHEAPDCPLFRGEFRGEGHGLSDFGKKVALDDLGFHFSRN